MVIVTVPARCEAWRRVGGPLGRHVSVQTASTFELSDDVQREHAIGRVVVDDTTLAASLKVEGFSGPMLTIERAANEQLELSPVREQAGAAA